MRLEYIVWAIQGSLMLVAILGAILVSTLPEPIRAAGWILLVLLGIAVAVSGFVWVWRVGDDGTGRYIWSR